MGEKGREGGRQVAGRGGARGGRSRHGGGGAIEDGDGATWGGGGGEDRLANGSPHASLGAILAVHLIDRPRPCTATWCRSTAFAGAGRSATDAHASSSKQFDRFVQISYKHKTFVQIPREVM